MLNPSTESSVVVRNARREKRLWHDGKNMPSLGCLACDQREVCGGLQVERPLFDCTSTCCGKPAACDRVCIKNPKVFFRSVREIDGFEFDNVPRAPLLPKPSITGIVPILYHGSKRVTPFRPAAACLPLYSVIARHDGTQRYASGAALAEKFGIGPEVPVILTGTDTDAPLERWWSLGAKRRDAIRALREIGVKLVTSPNYSLFTDRPRWDDLHSMKRIAIAYEEFLSQGLPAALHVNARTDRDWERWTRFVADRQEVTHLAFEFGTGAGWATRIPWHIDQLVGLSRAVGRPLHLVVRGGAKVLPNLMAAFDEVTFLETTVFTKTRARQRAVSTPSGILKWQKSPTAAGEALDGLLNENWQAVAECYAKTFGRPVHLRAAS